MAAATVINVIATERGWFGDNVRNEGAEFSVPSEIELGRWMAGKTEKDQARIDAHFEKLDAEKERAAAKRNRDSSEADEDAADDIAELKATLAKLVAANKPKRGAQVEPDPATEPAKTEDETM